MEVKIDESKNIKGAHTLSIGGLLGATFDDVDSSHYGEITSVSLLCDDGHVCTLWNDAATTVYNYWMEQKK